MPIPSRLAASIRPLTAALLVACTLAGAACRSTPPPPPLPAGVDWKPFEQGLAEAKASRRPICLIFYTDWCPHCRNYQKVFEDKAVIELSRRFVMIHENKEKVPEISARFAPDGDYIPRTLFLTPDGTLMPEVTEQRDDYRYFYDESDPASVMRSMKEVAARKF